MRWRIRRGACTISPVQPEQLMGTAARLGSSLEALAAVAAYLRVETEQLTVDPRVHDLLQAIAVEVLGEEPGVTRPQAAPVVGMTRALLAMSADSSTRRSAQRAGLRTTTRCCRASAASRRRSPASSPPPAVSWTGSRPRSAAPGAALLDVGTGTGWLAMAFAQAFPAAHVVGIDIYERSLALARQNVAAAGLADRVELRTEDATRLAEGDTYDAIWLPMPFLPRAIVPAIVEAAVGALRPGGWLLPGTFGGPPRPALPPADGPAPVRAGGHPWDGADLVDEIAGRSLENPTRCRGRGRRPCGCTPRSPPIMICTEPIAPLVTDARCQRSGRRERAVHIPDGYLSPTDLCGPDRGHGARLGRGRRAASEGRQEPLRAAAGRRRRVQLPGDDVQHADPRRHDRARRRRGAHRDPASARGRR